MASRVRRKTWRNKRGDPAWESLQEAMQQPFVDPLVVSMADTLACPYSSVRAEFLSFLKDIAESELPGRKRSKFSQIVAYQCFSTLISVDPFLAAWVNANVFASAIKQIKHKLTVLDSHAEADLAASVAEQILSMFSLSETKAELLSKDLQEQWNPDVYDDRDDLDSGTDLPFMVRVLTKDAVASAFFVRYRDALCGPVQYVDQTRREGDHGKNILNLVNRQMDSVLSTTKGIDAIFFDGRESSDIFLSSWKDGIDSIPAYPPTPGAA